MKKYIFSNHHALWKKLLIRNGVVIAFWTVLLFAVLFFLRINTRNIGNFFSWGNRYGIGLDVVIIFIVLYLPLLLLFRARTTITLEQKKITVKCGKRYLSTPYQKIYICRDRFTGWLTLRYSEYLGNYTLEEEEYAYDSNGQPTIINVHVDTRFPAYWLLWEEIIKRVSAENSEVYIDPRLEERIEKLKAKYPDKKLEGLIEKEAEL